EQLTTQVYEPAMVAVVGQVKVGKSSFINALLGADLAKVGQSETTATINQFRYGKATAERPVRVVWRGEGHEPAYETKEFLDSLQGNDEATLARAMHIDHLEYYLLNPYLEHITLVDTPGTGSPIKEHQNRSAEFMRLYQQL